MTSKSRSTSELRRVDRELSKLAGRIRAVKSPVAREDLFRRADCWADERLRIMRRLER